MLVALRAIRSDQENRDARIMDQTQTLIAKLETIRSIPSLPIVVQRLRRTVRNPYSDAKQIAGIIQDDPSMMARVLKVVNSVLYGGREPVASLQLAVARLGMSTVSNIATSVSVFSSFGTKGQKNFDRIAFWRHCIATGVIAEVVHERHPLKARAKYTNDFLHLCGLLHDIGKIVLEQHLHEEFMKAVKECRAKATPLIESEREILGSDHAQIGAWLGMKWNLPEDVLEVVRWHHDPASASPEHQDLVALCCLANELSNREKMGDGGDSAAPPTAFDSWARMGLSADDVPGVLDQAVQEMKKSEVLMSLIG